MGRHSLQKNELTLEFGTRLKGSPYLFEFYGDSGAVARVFPDGATAYHYVVSEGACSCPGYEHHDDCKHARLVRAVRGNWETLRALYVAHDCAEVWVDDLEAFARALHIGAPDAAPAEVTFAPGNATTHR